MASVLCYRQENSTKQNPYFTTLWNGPSLENLYEKEGANTFSLVLVFAQVGLSEEHDHLLHSLPGTKQNQNTSVAGLHRKAACSATNLSEEVVPGCRLGAFFSYHNFGVFTLITRSMHCV